VLEELFMSLTTAVYGSTGPAVAAAAGWGAMSIVLSPCHLASIPLVIGYLNAGRTAKPREAFPLALIFSLGILATIAAVGAATAAAGRMMGDLGPWGDRAVAVVFLAVGVHLTGLWTIPMPSGPQVGGGRRGPRGAFGLGLLVGLALGPCTFAFMAPVLGVVMSEAAERPMFASAMVAAFALGHCLVITLAGTSFQAVQGVLNWHERSRAGRVLRVICGLLVIAGGVYLLVR